VTAPHPPWLIGLMANWVTDFRHLVPVGAEGLPSAARQRGEFTRGVVEAATSRAAGPAWRSTVHCIARIGRRVCRTRVHVRHVAGETVEWSCEACGDAGVVTEFRGTEHDLSQYVPRGKTVLWGFDDESRVVLSTATTSIPSLRAIVARAKFHAEVADLLLVVATVAELNQMYTLVGDLMDLTRSRARIELLDALLASLSSSIDGF
jgi:hypothetical protein